jgi:hypothetical protein
MKVQRKIGANVIAVRIADDIVPMAEDLLDILEKLDKKGPALKEGSRIAYGWTTITIAESLEERNTLEVQEPYFGRGHDPVRQLQSGISHTARVILDQGKVCKSVGVEPVVAWYMHDVQLEPGVLDEEKVYLQRRPPASDHDTGWYVGSAEKKEGPAEDALETLAVWQVFERRRDLLDAMGLPVGYLAVFIDTFIDAILDPNNEEVFRA